MDFDHDRDVDDEEQGLRWRQATGDRTDRRTLSETVMSERITKFEDFYSTYIGDNKELLDAGVPLLMETIEQAFYAGALSGVGVIANRIAELEGSQDPSEVIQRISDVITHANTELNIANTKLQGQVGTG